MVGRQAGTLADISLSLPSSQRHTYPGEADAYTGAVCANARTFNLTNNEPHISALGNNNLQKCAFRPLNRTAIVVPSSLKEAQESPVPSLPAGQSGFIMRITAGEIDYIPEKNNRLCFLKRKKSISAFSEDGILTL